MHFYEPAKGHGLKHDPFNAIIGPRPIGWISTLSQAGVPNLAPYSFFNAFNYVPPIIGFSSVGWKDSVANIAATKEFVWNLATRPLAEQMNASSAMVAADVDEFALANLAPAPCRLVGPSRVAASPVAMECRLADLVQLKSAAGDPVESWLVLGEVIGIHIEESLIEGGVYDTAGAQPILRAGGAGDYFGISLDTHFFLRRPR